MNNNIIAIHVLKNKLGLSDEDYRAMLFENFKKSSSKDLTQKQQLQLITFLNSQAQVCRNFDIVSIPALRTSCP